MAANAKKRLGAEPTEGDNVLIRTVTHYYTGKIESIGERFIRLGDAAWIADTGRFSDALRSGSLNEIEPYPGACFVSLGAVVDISPWEHALPREKK